jgi:hypothetical protein
MSSGCSQLTFNEAPLRKAPTRRAWGGMLAAMAMRDPALLQLTPSLEFVLSAVGN